MLSRSDIQELCRAHDYVLDRIRKLEPSYLPTRKFFGSNFPDGATVEADNLVKVVQSMEFKLAQLQGGIALPVKAGKAVAMPDGVSALAFLPPPSPPRRDPPRSPPHSGGGGRRPPFDDDPKPHDLGGSSAFWGTPSDNFATWGSGQSGSVTFRTMREGHVTFRTQKPPVDDGVPEQFRKLGIRAHVP